MGKGSGRPVVGASMSAVRFVGDWKWRGEWGVKKGESVVPFLGEEGSSGQRQRTWEVAAGRASGGRRQPGG
jgi:hypothetical protein